MIRRILSAAVLPCFFLLAGCSHPGPVVTPSPQTLGGMMVTLNADAPHTGDNTLVVTLADAATHLPVGNANITATADMLSPRLPGTPVSGRAQGNGVYNLPIRLGIATRYSLILEITRPGQPPVEARFPLEAAQ